MQATLPAPLLRSPRVSEDLQGSIPTPFPRELIGPLDPIYVAPAENLSSQVIHEDASELAASSSTPGLAISPPQDAGDLEIDRDVSIRYHLF